MAGFELIMYGRFSGDHRGYQFAAPDKTNGKTPAN